MIRPDSSNAFVMLVSAALVATIALGSPRIACATTSTEAMLAARARLRAAASSAKLNFPLALPVIHIRKSIRALDLYDGGTLVRTYTVALGLNPEGAKTESGDMRTTEGTYFVCSRNDVSQFHLFLGRSYPKTADAEAARKSGHIDAATAARIARAESARQKPDWSTKLGGAVGIHGGGTGRDWTWGCIALSNEDIDELWCACPVGTKVVIER